MAEIKRVTLHPLNPDGTIDTNTNLYPKTLTTGIVNEEGEAVNFPDDSVLVHNSGNENIGGEKTFTNNITIATPAGWAGLYLSTDAGQSLGFIEMGEKGTTISSTDNFYDPEDPNPYYGKTVGFNIDVRTGAHFNLYDGKISFSQRMMQNPCSGYLQFKNINNVDELHLVTYSNDVQTDIVFPAGIDDRVELATKDQIDQKADKIGLIPNVNTINPNTKIIDFIAGLSKDEGFFCGILSTIGGPRLIGWIKKIVPGTYTITAIDSGNNYSLTVNSSSTSTFADLLNTKKVLEKQENKVTTISSSSTDEKYPSAKAVYGLVATTGTKFYKHHFDVILTHADLALIPENSDVHIQVNALSTSATPWATLGELNGGGFIVSAFGNVSNNYYYVFELKLFYAAVNALMVNFNNLISNSVTPYAVTSCGGGQVPST